MTQKPTESLQGFICNPALLLRAHRATYLKVLKHNLSIKKEQKYCTTHEVLTDDSHRSDGKVTADCSKHIYVFI